MSGAQGDVAGTAAEGAPGANGDRDSVDDVIERLLSVRGEGVGGGVVKRRDFVFIAGSAERNTQVCFISLELGLGRDRRSASGCAYQLSLKQTRRQEARK